VRRRRRAAPPPEVDTPDADASDASTPADTSTPDEDAPAAETPDEGGADDGPNQKEEVVIAYGVTTLVGAAEALMAAPHGVEAADLTDARGKLNPARVRAAADAARLVFPDLFGEG
ncbi:MAG TPA: hypothetical protein VK610_04630, partial [Rhodothermales bacterium]|nr:hypothetical protein [Rhodothermales bacterium]